LTVLDRIYSPSTRSTRNNPQMDAGLEACSMIDV
jgi:hypothetical protein